MADDTAASRLRPMLAGLADDAWFSSRLRPENAGDALLALVEAAEFVLRRAVTDGVVRSHTADVLGVPNLRTCLTALRDSLPPVEEESR